MKRSDPNYIKAWRQEKSKDPTYKAKKAAYAKQYREKNKDKIQKHSSTSYLKHAESRKIFQQNKYHLDIEASRIKLKERATKMPWKIMCSSAKARAKKQGLDFDLTQEYIQSIWPVDNKCPVFRFDLTKSNLGESRDQSPSLDRIIPLKGYVKGNVTIVSLKANRMKNNGSLDDLQKVIDYYTFLNTRST